MAKKREFVPKQSLIHESKVNKMPPVEDCYFHLLTMSGVRVRTLFDAVHNVVENGILIIDENGISLDKMDNTTTMVVYVKLDQLGPNGEGSYYCEKRIEVGLNFSSLHDALNVVVQGDMLGLCVTKKSWDTDRTIDVHIVNDQHGYAYVYHIRALALDYEKLGLQDTNVQTQLSILCTHFKRILHDCQKQGDYLCFQRRYNPKTQYIETVLRPIGDRLNSTELELTLFNPPPDGFDEKKYKFDTRQQYSIASLQLFTKATTLCKNVEIFISEEFPLVVQYMVGDLGTLRFLLAPRIHTSTWDDTVIDTATVTQLVGSKRKRSTEITEGVKQQQRSS